MFKVNNKDTRSKSLSFSALFIVNFEHILHFFSAISIVDLEQVNICWEGYLTFHDRWMKQKMSLETKLLRFLHEQHSFNTVSPSNEQPP